MLLAVAVVLWLGSEAMAQGKFEVRIGEGANQVLIEDDGPLDNDEKDPKIKVRTPNLITFEGIVDYKDGRKFIVSLTVRQKIVAGKSAEITLGPITISHVGTMPVTDEVIRINSSALVPAIGPPFTGRVHLSGRYGSRGGKINNADVKLQGMVFHTASELPDFIGIIDPPAALGLDATFPGTKFGPDHGHKDKSAVLNVSVRRLQYLLQFSFLPDDRIYLENSAVVSGYAAERIFTVNTTQDLEDGDTADGICDIGSANPNNRNFPLKGICPLRAALVQSELSDDLTPLPNAIHFNIPGEEVPVIRVSENLSFNRGTLGTLRPVILDGTTQAAGQVVLDGSEAAPVDIAGNDIVGLDLVGKDIEVRGLMITGFPSHGIEIRPTGAPEGGSNLIEGNFIQNNGGDGVHIFEMPNNTIAGNFIRDNTGHGIAVEDPDIAPDLDGKGNRLLGNLLHGNQQLGIALSGQANHGQAAPVLTSAAAGIGQLDVGGTLNSSPGTVFTLQFFANSMCDPSGFGEAEDFLGSTLVETDAGGSAVFSVSLPVSLPPGQSVTATAIDPEGNTSAFSACIPAVSVAQLADLELSKQADKSQLTVGEQLVFTVRLLNKGPDAATNVAVSDLAPAGLTFNQITPSSGSFDGNTGLWSVPALNSGEEAALVILATATQAGTILNTAEVMASDQLDPDSAPANGQPAEDDQSSIALTVQEVVVSPEQQTLDLIVRVFGLVAEGEIQIKDGRRLVRLLAQALSQMERDNTVLAIKKLEAFNKEVQELTDKGELAAAVGQELIADAQQIIDQLNAQLIAIQDKVKATARFMDAGEASAGSRRLGNYPNPFVTATMIVFELEKPVKVQLAVYDQSGRVVGLLLDGMVPAGLHTFAWSPDKLPAGVYILQLQAGHATKAHRMLYVK